MPRRVVCSTISAASSGPFGGFSIPVALDAFASVIALILSTLIRPHQAVSVLNGGKEFTLSFCRAWCINVVGAFFYFGPMAKAQED